jgi:poly(A) polymerase
MSNLDHSLTAAGRSGAGLVARLQSAGHTAFFAGGAVRDMLLGREISDIDIATSARPDEVRRLFKNVKEVGAAFGVMLVSYRRRVFEVATFRTEGTYSDGRHPDSVSFANAESDAQRRDFTCNALFYDPGTGKIIDYVDGRADIKSGRLRAVGEAGTRFAEDHLRLLRAVRFAGCLNFEIASETRKALTKMSGRISGVSGERIRDEVIRMLQRGGSPARRCFELMQELGLLQHIFPELEKLVELAQPPQFHPEGDCWQHTLCCLEQLKKGANTNLALAVLFHDLGKGVTASTDPDGRIRFNRHATESARIVEKICDRLRTSNADRNLIEELVGWHMRFIDLPRMREAKLKRFLRNPNFKLHLELHRIDCLASHGNLDTWRFARRKNRLFSETDLTPRRLLSGEDLIKAGLPQGPLIGKLLAKLEIEQLENRINCRQQALLWLRSQVKRLK